MDCEYFRLAFDQAPFGAAFLALDGSFLRANRLFCDILDLSEEELTSRSLMTSEKALLIDSIVEAARAAVGNTANMPVEQRFVRRDWRVAWVSISTNLVRDEQGLPHHIFCQLQDVTERKGADEQTKVLTQLLDNMDHSIVVSDATGKLTYCNRSAEKDYGRTFSELIGLRVSHITFSPFTDKEKSVLWGGLRQGVTYKGEYVGRRRDGSLFPGYTIVTPIFDESGEFTAAASISIDLTKGKQAEEAMHQSENQLQAFAERSHAIFYRYRIYPTLVCEYASSVITLILGYTPQELYDDPLVVWKNIHPDDMPVIESLLNPSADVGSATSVRCFHKDGHLVWLEWRHVPIYDGDRMVAIEGIARDVTEQKQGAERLERITQASHDWLWEYDPQENIHWWNRPRREAMGLSANEEPTANLWESSIHPDDRERVLATFLAADRDRKTNWTMEYRHQIADGSYRTILERGNCLRDSEGKATKYFGALVDITERKAAEEALRQQEALLRAVIDTFPFPISGRDRDGQVIIQNTMSKKWWKSQIGRGFDESTHHPDLLAQWREQHARALKGEVVQVEADYIINGEPRQVHEIIAPVRAGRETIGTVCIQMDITKRKLAEANLRRSEARFRTVWEKAIDAMALSDADGTVLFANPAYYRLYGYTPEQVIGQPFNIIFPEAMRPTAMDGYKAIFQMQREIAETESTVVSADGTSMTVIAGLSFVEKEGQRELMLSVLRDITEIRQADNAMKQAIDAQLQHIERFSNVNNVSRAVSGEVFMPSALNIVAKSLADIFRASDVTISRLENEQSTLAVITRANRPPESTGENLISDAEVKTILLDDDPIARLAISGEKRIVISGGEPLGVLPPDWQQVPSSGTRSVIAVPLRARKNVVGLMSISCNEAGRSFAAAKLSWLQSIAGSIASSIETARLFTEGQRQRVIAESLQEVLAALSSSLDRETVMDIIFEKLHKFTPYYGAAIYLRNGNSLDVTEATGFANRYIKLRLPLGKAGPPQDVLKSKRPKLIEDPATYPNWHLHDSSNQINAWMGAPLMVGSRAIGILAVCHSKPGAYTQKDLETLQTIAQHAAVALANSLYYEQARATAADNERNRLARDLHDSVTQALFSASLIADVLPQLTMQDPPKTKEALYTLQKLTRGALAEMRALLLELRPSDLHRVRLDIAISQLATAATLRDSLDLDTHLDVAPPLPQNVQVALYRIAQEALNNIVKHARAHCIKITLQTDPLTATTTDGASRRKIVLEIDDDGVGFLPEQIAAGHLGLSIMHERAKEVRANLQVVSIPGKGSKVIVVWEGTMLLKEKHRMKGVGRHDDYTYVSNQSLNSG